MTTAELIERLRNWPADFMSDRVMLLEAAARLREQEAELARLREALEEIASYDDGPMAGVAYTAKIALATDQKGGD